MIPVKRLEIVIEASHSAQVTDLLLRSGLTGWTRMRGASGSGDRGLREDDLLTGVASNHVIVAACPPEHLETVLEELRPLLARLGGMCLVSEARWLVH